jgi:hypothetical protein
MHTKNTALNLEDAEKHVSSDTGDRCIQILLIILLIGTIVFEF